MRWFALLLIFLLPGCAAFESKPQTIRWQSQYGYEDLGADSDPRWSSMSGPIVEFENGYRIGVSYRFRQTGSRDEHGAFLQYSMPIWKAREGGAWGEGEWELPFLPSQSKD